jgi:hypothetical protein
MIEVGPGPNLIREVRAAMTARQIYGSRISRTGAG